MSISCLPRPRLPTACQVVCSVNQAQHQIRSKYKSTTRSNMSISISRAGGTAGWLWNLRPANAERPTSRFPAQPDRTSTTGPPGATSTPPRSHTETPSRYSSGPPSAAGQGASRQPRLQVGHHWPPSGRNLRQPLHRRNKQAPHHDPAATTTDQNPNAFARKTLAGLGSDPPLQDHARTQLQGPRNPGNRLILPQVKPKPQDNAAPRPPRHQRGT